LLDRAGGDGGKNRGAGGWQLMGGRRRDISMLLQGQNCLSGDQRGDAIPIIALKPRRVRRKNWDGFKKARRGNQITFRWGALPPGGARSGAEETIGPGPRKRGRRLPGLGLVPQAEFGPAPYRGRLKAFRRGAARGAVVHQREEGRAQTSTRIFFCFWPSPRGKPIFLNPITRDNPGTKHFINVEGDSSGPISGGPNNNWFFFFPTAGKTKFGQKTFFRPARIAFC